MSGSNPFDKFEQGGERTVIRPNPAGRRPASPPQAPGAASPPPGQSPSPPPGQPPGPPPGYPPGMARPAPPAPQPARPAAAVAVAGGPADDWIKSPDARPPQFIGHMPLPEINFTDLVAPHVNPLMSAAAPLLMLLGRLRIAVLRASFAKLISEVGEAVEFFEKSVRKAGISDEQTRTSKYILCATADDIVQNIPTDERHVWAQYSMLSRFFQERLGGERFFEILTKGQMDPVSNYDVLELTYTCLALGFQGKYRHSGQGAVELQQIQRNLYEILRRVRPRAEIDLSPNWRGQALAGKGGRLRVPMWSVFALSAGTLVGLFFVLRALLGDAAEAAAAQVAAMHGKDKIDLQRRVYVAPKPPPEPVIKPGQPLTQLQRIKSALAAEIASGEVSADQNAQRIFIHVGNKVLFASGQATVLDTFKPIATRIAEVLDKEPGTISIVGHTDNVKLANTSRFKDNYDLSVERAKAVAAILKPKLAQTARIEVSGKAEMEPIADNKDEAGRRQNRRVDLNLTRTGD